MNNNVAPASLAKSYRPEVDGLRCLAVCAVIFYHAGFSLFSGGFVGVDVFFVISGYLITGIIYKEVTEQRFSFINFYERRMRRIFPALFFVLICCLIPAFLWLTPEQLKNFSQSLVAVIIFVSNLYFWLKSGYFDENSETLPLLHTWSLSVEEQFYIFFPILLLILWRFKAKLLGLMLSICLVGSLAFCLYLETKDQSMNFFWPHTRAWELLVGALISIYHQRITAPFKANPMSFELLSGIGLVMIVATILLLDKHASFPGVNAIWPVLGTGLIIAFANQNTLVGKLFSLKPIVMIGLLSYSAYLWHQPLFAFTRLVSESGVSAVVYAVLIVATFVLSYISWRFIENPFRDKKAYSRQFIYLTSFAFMGVFMLIGVSGHLLKGLPQRFSAEHNALAATADASPYRESCHTWGLDYLTPEKACTYFDGDVKWAVMGDSHVVELAHALAKKVEPQGLAVKHLSFSGCSPAYQYDTTNPGCTQWTKAAVEYLANSPNIEQILLVYRHGFYLHGDQLGQYPHLPDEHPFLMRQFAKNEAFELYEQSFIAMVNALTAAGKKVYVLAPVPELGASIDRNVFNISWDLSAKSDPNGATLDYYLARQQRSLATLERLTKLRHVEVVYPADALCQGQQCYAIMDNKALYFDDNHLSLTGAAKVVDLMFNQENDNE